jgi:hypothetical protein
MKGDNMVAPAKYFTDKPYTFKCFEASTAHIKPEDAKLLDVHNGPLVVYAYEYGHYVFTGRELDETEYAELRKFGFSGEFIQLIKLANKNGCKFLVLDGDGVTYSDLPVFEWE